MTRIPLPVLLLVLSAFSVLAVPPPSAIYTLTLNKAAPDGGDLDVQVVTTLGMATRGEAGGVLADATKVVIEDAAIRGDLTAAGQTWTLAATVGADTITGTYAATVEGKAVTGGISGSWQARDTFPVGHRDFYPSPTQSIGFAGQGRNWYPGATPPTEFWEGTPTRIPVDVNGQRGKATLWSYADNTAKNIRWKRPHPGWSDALPLAVGDRVITLHSPHYVVCWDANTGDILWQDELKVMLLDPMMSASSPALDEQAKLKRQALFEAGLAYYRFSTGISPGKKVAMTEANMAPRRPMLVDGITALEGWKTAFGADFPEVGAAIDQTLNGPLGLKTILAALDARDFTAVNKAKGGAVGIPTSFVGAVERITGIRLGNCWPGHVGDVMATPVSDGTAVYVTFGHGQVAAYDLVLGKRLWARRDPTMNAMSVSHAPSPLLWKDLLIVTSGSGPRGAPTLRALDTRTGELRWQSDGGLGGCPIGVSHGDHMSHYLHRLPDGKGGVRAIIVTNKGAVLDAETGKTLIERLPSTQNRWGSGFVAGTGDLIFRTWGGDCKAPPCEVWQLRFTAPDTLEATARPEINASNSHGPWALSDTSLIAGGRLVDPRTGGWQTSKTDREAVDVPGGSPTIAGKYLVLAGDLTGDWARSRPDRMALSIITFVDVSDPANPRVLPGTNLLGDAAMPPDIMDKFFPNTAADPALKANLLGCYFGLPSWFGVRMGGVTAQGDRLFIMSNSHLYCIGEK